MKSRAATLIALLFATLACVMPVLGQAAERGVVSAADPRAAEAGREMLRQGGSAADAAMAMMLALTVVEPQSSGIGGGGFILYHDAASGMLGSIDGREMAPASATPNLFVGADGKSMPFMQAVPGGRSVGIPGNIALMAETHRRWGKLKWKQLFAPAIRLAKDGYQVSPLLAGRLAMLSKVWADFPDARAIYWQDGRPKQAGEVVRNPALATFLGKLASGGPNVFYRGANARAIAKAVSRSPRNPVVLKPAEIARYRAKLRDPVCAPYRQYRLCGMGPPSSGATTVFQILGLLERFDMKALGKDSPVAWHLIAEAMQLAYADRETYLADGDFVKVPVAGLLDRGYLAERSGLIAQDKALPTYQAGRPPGAAPRTTALSSEVPATTHFVAVDRAGNVASMTSTVEGPFGSQIVVNGYFLNNELTDFTFAPERNGAPVANRVEAGKRPLSSMAPTIVYGPDGKVVFALGSAGGKRIIMHVAKTLVGLLDWNLDAQQAVALPNIYFAGAAVNVESGTKLDAMRADLARLGQMVLSSELGSKVNAIERTPDGWRGVADPRSEGVALQE